MRDKQWHRAIEEWLTWLRAGGASPGTVRLRRYQLARFADAASRGPWATPAAELEQWLAGQERWTPATRSSNLAALRGFYRWALDQDRVEQDPTARLPRVRTRPGEPRPAAEQIVASAMAAGDERVRLMAALAAAHGLRRAEVAAVHTRHVVPGNGGWSLRVLGKGGRVRTVPLLPVLAEQLRRAPTGWVFPSPKGGHLTAGHVGVLLARAMEYRATPHQLRHRFATRSYQATRDLLAVQRLLGHASVATTQVYAAPAADAMRAAVQAAAA